MAVLIYVPYKTFILFNFVQFTLYKECGNFLSGAIRKIALCTSKENSFNVIITRSKFFFCNKKFLKQNPEGPVEYFEGPILL